MEKETTGLYLSGHPMDQYRELAKRFGAVTIGSILSDFAREEGPQAYRDDQRVSIAGVISSYRTRTTRNNTLMAYVMLEDDTASMELICFSRALNECGGYIRENSAILATGESQVVLYFADCKKRVGSRCEIHPALLKDLKERLGEENVVVK